MSARPKLLSLDAFAKTVEDARIKTASGGIITLLCIVIALFLIRNEYTDYTTLITRPELVVDRDINKQLDINLDISFLNLPCQAVSIDILDETGDMQLDIIHSGFQKIRLIKENGAIIDERLDEIPEINSKVPLSEAAKGLQEGQDPKTCGSCYGALPQDKHQYCCNNCETVRRAYAERSWSFFDGENIEQCEKEGYVKKIRDRVAKNEGCRIKGTAKISRVSGSMEFAPGSLFTSDGRHAHDLSLYAKYGDKLNFDHIINHLSFGTNGQSTLSTTTTHPLDGHQFLLHQKAHLASYYLKVVATRFESITKESIDTNQFSVITHDRPLIGGKDEDHQHTMHGRGGVPGVEFHFDISPLKIINREQYAKSWSGFVLGCVSSIAGVLMVGTLIDRTVFAAQNAIKGKKDM
ncbi:ERV46 [[Candida] subhashii]|uniref:Endoplasmic reticulum-Golgi intermediate compartment protein n=1 Tax=[Candida] subhashii TaxID=561895 RepID=A0A8J5QI02_9ASCO|nr:ERV46 [[Candida] subhashii]KAG7661496.1 ERV46 [[Candida] subhashii]